MASSQHLELAVQQHAHAMNVLLDVDTDEARHLSGPLWGVNFRAESTGPLVVMGVQPRPEPWNRELIARLPRIECVVLIPGTKTVAVGTIGGNVFLVDTAGKTVTRRTPTPFSHAVTSLAALGPNLIVGTGGGEVFLLPIDGQAEPGIVWASASPPEAFGRRVSSLAVIGERRVAIGASTGELVVVDTTGADQTVNIWPDGLPRRPIDHVLALDATKVLATNSAGVVVSIDVSSPGRPLRAAEWLRSGRTYGAARLGPDRALLAVGGYLRIAHVVDRELRVLHTVIGPKQAVTSGIAAVTPSKALVREIHGAVFMVDTNDSRSFVDITGRTPFGSATGALLVPDSCTAIVVDSNDLWRVHLDHEPPEARQRFRRSTKQQRSPRAARIPKQVREALAQAGYGTRPVAATTTRSYVATLDTDGRLVVVGRDAIAQPPHTIAPGVHFQAIATLSDNQLCALANGMLLTVDLDGDRLPVEVLDARHSSERKLDAIFQKNGGGPVGTSKLAVLNDTTVVVADRGVLIAVVLNEPATYHQLVSLQHPTDNPEVVLTKVSSDVVAVGSPDGVVRLVDTRPDRPPVCAQVLLPFLEAPLDIGVARRRSLDGSTDLLVRTKHRCIRLRFDQSAQFTRPEQTKANPNPGDNR